MSNKTVPTVVLPDGRELEVRLTCGHCKAILVAEAHTVEDCQECRENRLHVALQCATEGCRNRVVFRIGQDLLSELPPRNLQ